MNVLILNFASLLDVLLHEHLLVAESTKKSSFARLMHPSQDIIEINESINSAIGKYFEVALLIVKFQKGIPLHTLHGSVLSSQI